METAISGWIPSAVGIAGISTSGTSTFNVISANTYRGIILP